jgi:hypothetical protein
MKRYRIFDTVTLEVVSETGRYQEARATQKLLNTSPCAIFHGNGYVVRFALQDTRYPRSKSNASGLEEPRLEAHCG